jgi:hypothetical protein
LYFRPVESVTLRFSGNPPKIKKTRPVEGVLELATLTPVAGPPVSQASALSSWVRGFSLGQFGWTCELSAYRGSAKCYDAGGNVS